MSPVIPDQLKLVLSWHGVKKLDSFKGHYTLPQADFYIDARNVPEHGLKFSGKAGNNPDLQKEMIEVAGEVFDLMTDQIIQAVERIPQRRWDEADPFAKPFCVTFLCALGVTRSRAACLIVSRELKQLGYNVAIGDGSGTEGAVTVKGD